MDRVRQAVARQVNLGCLALAALVVAATLHQIYASKFDRLTPWKGGGFGMYTAPHGTARAVFVMLGDTPLRLAPPENALEDWIDGLDRDSAAFLKGLVQQATALRFYPQTEPARRLMASVARVHWPTDLAGAGGVDGLFKPAQLQLIVTELARRPVAGHLEQRVIFTLGGD